MSSAEDNETHEDEEEAHEEEEEEAMEADDNVEDDDDDEDEEDAKSGVDDDQAEDDTPSKPKESKSNNSSSETPPKRETAEALSPAQETPAPTGTSATTTPVTTTGDKRKKRKGMPAGLGGSKKGRSPAVRGLTIPFRTVKKAMKLDPDIPIVQNEAAIMTTLASELFLKSLAKESFGNAKARGRNTIRYEDVAEARTQKPALAFLETLLP